jgi:hypothetical protein
VTLLACPALTIKETTMADTVVVGSRMSLAEKRLVEAVAAKRSVLVSHLIRDLLLREIAQELGESAAQVAAD